MKTLNNAFSFYVIIKFQNVFNAFHYIKSFKSTYQKCYTLIIISNILINYFFNPGKKYKLFTTHQYE